MSNAEGRPPAADFHRIAIVGRGLIGGSIQLAIEARRPSLEVVALDRDDELARIGRADLVILAAPILENIRLLDLVRPHLSPHALLTDTGSTKRAMLRAAAGLRFIGGHPIAGAATGGFASARADLFEGRAWVLTPTTDAAEADLARLKRFIEALGAAVECLDAAEHDRTFALVSHLPQLVISALMDVIGSQGTHTALRLAGPGLRDSTRLASSPPEMWRDILETNRDNIGLALDAAIENLSSLKEDAAGAHLRAVFERAARWRRILEERPI